MNRLECHRVQDELPRLAEGVLSPSQALSHRRHLLDCPDCRQAEISMAALDAGLRDLAPVDVPDDFAAHVLAALPDAPPRRRPRLMAVAGGLVAWFAALWVGPTAGGTTPAWWVQLPELDVLQRLAETALAIVQQALALLVGVALGRPTPALELPTLPLEMALPFLALMALATTLLAGVGAFLLRSRALPIQVAELPGRDLIDRRSSLP